MGALVGGDSPPGVGGSAMERRLFDENGMNKIVAGGVSRC